jgi:hypothetical protein
VAAAAACNTERANTPARSRGQRGRRGAECVLTTRTHDGVCLHMAAHARM